MNPLENSVFVGRTAEVARLVEIYQKALSVNKMQAAFVTGEAGSGKSALVEKVLSKVTDIAEIQPRIVRIRCTLESENSGFLPFTTLIRRLYDLEIHEALAKRSDRERLQKTLKMIKEVAPALLDFVLLDIPSKAVNIYDSLAEFTKNEKIESPVFSRSSVFEQFQTLIHQKGKIQPVIIFFDDIQWMDHSSLALLLYLCQNPPASPVYILAAYRSRTIPADSDKSDMLLEMVRRGGAEIPELTHGISVLEYVNARFPGHDIPVHVIKNLQQKTSGYPLFVVELFNQIVENQIILPLSDGTGYQFSQNAYQEMDIPSTVLAIIRQRLSGLRDEMRDILSTASVEGELFTVQVVAQIQRLDTDQTLKFVEELEHVRNLVLESGLKMTATQKKLFIYRFIHRFFRDYIYDNLSVARRNNLHLRVGESLEELYTEQPEIVASQLAHHFRLGDDTEKALRYSFLATEVEESKYCWTEASLHATHAFELARQKQDTLTMAKAVVLLERNAYRAERLGGVLQKLVECEQLLEGQPAAKEALLEVLIAQASAYYWHGDTRAEPAAEKAMRIAEELNNPQHLYDAMYIFKDVLEDLHGWYDRSRKVCEELIELADQMHDNYRKVDAIGNLAWSLIDLGQLHRSIALCEEGQRIMSENHMEQYELKAMLIRFAGLAYHELGDYPRALELCEEALKMYRSKDEKILIYEMQIEVATIQADMHENPTTVYRTMKDALQLAIELENVGGISYAHNWIAYVALLEGNLPVAKKSLEDAQAGVAASDSRWNNVQYHVNWAKYYYLAGNLDTALEKATEAIPLIDGVESIVITMPLYMILGQIYTRMGIHSLAENWLSTAAVTIENIPDAQVYQAELQQLFGELEISKNQYKQAYEHLKKCYDIYRNLSHYWAADQVMLKLVDAGLKSGNYLPLKRTYHRRHNEAPNLSCIDPRIFYELYFGYCLECSFCQDRCCQYGVDIDILNVKRIGRYVEPIEDYIGIPRKEWFEQTYQRSNEYPGGSYTRTRTKDGACVFLNRNGRGCLLQKFCVDHGIDYHELKPFVSSLFPLTYDYGLLHPSWEIDKKDLVCAGQGVSLYRGVRDELLHYYGQEFVAELDQLELEQSAFKNNEM